MTGSQERVVLNDRYEIQQRIGRGGMADVFLSVARGQMGVNKLAVIKRLRPVLAEEAAFRNMFLDEARLARDPSIWPDGVPRRRRARPPRETLAEIEALIAAHGGVAATARALGVTKQAISGRLHTARRRAG